MNESHFSRSISLVPITSFQQSVSSNHLIYHSRYFSNALTRAKIRRYIYLFFFFFKRMFNDKMKNNERDEKNHQKVTGIQRYQIIWWLGFWCNDAIWIEPCHLELGKTIKLLVTMVYSLHEFYSCECLTGCKGAQQALLLGKNRVQS